MNPASVFKLALAMLGVGVVATSTVSAQAPQALLRQYKCYLCHADRETKTGPAYVDVAVRYRDDPKAVGKLAGVMKQGRRGMGEWHMSPHREISDADARAIVRYILSLRE